MFVLKVFKIATLFIRFETGSANQFFLTLFSVSRFCALTP
jgi:hypothetical protein